jgi:hypothetical protein
VVAKDITKTGFESNIGASPETEIVSISSLIEVPISHIVGFSSLVNPNNLFL